jgi:hypothetical protein
MRVEDAARADARPSPAPSGGATTFYRYRDASGRLVIVDSPTRVPASQRASAEAVVLAPAGESAAVSGGAVSDAAVSAARGLARDLHMPSFIAGLSLALLVALLFVVVGRKLGRWFRGALVLGLLGVGVVAYFGWVRRTTGQSGDLLASPGALIEDARGAVQKLNQRTAEQQRTLQELEHVE